MNGVLGLKLVESTAGTRHVRVGQHASVGSGSLAATAYLDVEGGGGERVNV